MVAHKPTTSVFYYFCFMYIDCHTHTIKSDADISVLNSYPDDDLSHLNHSNLLSCGIHPWYLESNKIQHDLERIEQLCRQHKIAAVGECGLDKNTKDIKLQKGVFEQQLALSEQYNLPLIIHSLKTHHLIHEFEKLLKPKQTWIIHGYNGSLQSAQQFMDKNIFISFGENLIKYPAKFKNILNQVDVNLVLLETDDGAIGIRDVYAQAAKLLDMELEVLKEIIKQNFKRVFR